MNALPLNCFWCLWNDIISDIKIVFIIRSCVVAVSVLFSVASSADWHNSACTTFTWTYSFDCVFSDSDVGRPIAEFVSFTLLGSPDSGYPEYTRQSHDSQAHRIRTTHRPQAPSDRQMNKPVEIMTIRLSFKSNINSWNGCCPEAFPRFTSVPVRRWHAILHRIEPIQHNVRIRNETISVLCLCEFRNCVARH